MRKGTLRPKSFCQVGLVVKDIEKAVEKYSQLLSVRKPRIIITDELEKSRTVYHGLPTPARAKLAFFNLGRVQLELIEPVSGPSTWREHLEEHGESLHHLAFNVEDTAGAVHGFLEQGVEVAQQGYYEGGMYTYMNSQEAYGAVFELLQNF